MITTSCEFCFREYKLKDDLAGKTFRCKSCSEPVKVPAASTRKATPKATRPADPWEDLEEEDWKQAPPPAAVVRRPSSESARKQPARKRKSTSETPGILTKIFFGVAGVLLLGVVIGVFVPIVLAIVTPFAALLGIAVAMASGIMLLVLAFQEDPICGVMYIFVPFYSLYYIITRWQTTGRYFLLNVGAVVLVLAPVLVTTVQQAREAARQNVARAEEQRLAEEQIEQDIAEMADGFPAAAPGQPGFGFPEPAHQPAGPPADPFGGFAAPPVQPPPGANAGAPQPVSGLPPNSEAVFGNVPLAPGTAVWALWGSQWYQGEILSAEGPGRYKVHYVGWGNASDEVLPFSRIRLRK